MHNASHSITAVLAALITLVLTSCGISPDPDTTFRLEHIKGHTLSGGEWVEFEAMAVREGVVVAIGSLEEVRRALPEARVEDGQGAVVLPGLIDAHVHVMGLGYQLTEVDVTGLESLEETVAAVKAFAEAHPDAPWILGRGWNQVLWKENRFPSASDLDRAVSGRPVYLSRIDGHAGWVNSKALEMAGVGRDTPDPVGGRVIRDDRGSPTGVLIDAAEQYITAHIPEKTPEQQEQALDAALESMVRHGLTSVHDAGIDASTWELFRAFERSDRLPLRIYAMVGGVGPATLPLLKKGPVHATRDGRLALQSVKLYSDGALGSRGAALLHPYHDEPDNQGLLFYSQQEMDEMVTTTLRYGFQANVHAIGDAANRQVIDALRRAQQQTRPSGQGFRNRVEHAQVVALEDIPRFKELGLIASMQPTHATSDMNMAEDRVGAERIRGAYAWRTFLEQGTVVAFGSDVPVENVNPFFGLYSAVTRQDHQGRPPQGWIPEQKVTRQQALRGFTLDAAYAAFDEHRLGSLEPGKRADFIVIDRDYFTVPADEIWQIRVQQTWVEGRKVYDHRYEGQQALPGAVQEGASTSDPMPVQGPAQTGETSADVRR